MEKYVCIHGHFYQPPRENPWLEAIEVQDSAYPYRDWNERITAECYNPNTAARILGDNTTVTDIVNNYSRMSFNFGPTLLSWMEDNAPEVYKSILQADKDSMELYSGHGSAIAQNYGHTIMPLNNSRDKRTQILWGIEDFRFRFKREPEGMWLAETAVDIETLEILAENNIKFTILAPRQAGKVKEIKSKQWIDVSDSSIDPKKLYVCNLPSGNKINLFFYDGPISQELAFGTLLKNGENLANRLVGTYNQADNSAQIAHIATDGETYGHHQRHGDMALAYCLNFIEQNELAKITIYGEFLEKHPPEWEVQIIENTSWSCIHGVERWRSNCGCNSGREGWNQEWRMPLRETLDWLRDKLIPIYENEASVYVRDVWKLRDNYVKIILDRNPENIKKVFEAGGIKSLSKNDLVHLLKLLEIQRHAMLMYTSCGWFFDEISGIETVQVILYAARAMQLTSELTGEDFEPEFIKRMEGIKSNLPELGNGKVIYQNYVKPAVIDLLRVGAHYAVSAMFEEYNDNSSIFCYEVFPEDYDQQVAGRVKLAIGRARMRSKITYDEILFTHAVYHLGDHNLNGGIRESRSMRDYNQMKKDFSESFPRQNFAEIIHLLDDHFGSHNYTLWHLFKDESRKVFNRLLQGAINDIEVNFRQIYENHYPMMLAMLEAQIPLPRSLYTAVEFLLNTDLKKILESDDSINPDALQRIKDESKKWNIRLTKEALALSAGRKINKLVEKITSEDDNLNIMTELNMLMGALKELGLDMDLWKAQNTLYIYSKEEMYKSDGRSEEWYSKFNELERNLEMRLE